MDINNNDKPTKQIINFENEQNYYFFERLKKKTKFTKGQTK